MPSVLETFYFLFEADASKLVDGMKKAQKEAEKTEDQLKKTDDLAVRIGESFQDFIKKGGAALLGFLAVRSVASAFTETADEIDLLNDRAESLSLDPGDLQAWSRAALMSGGTADGFAGSLETLNIGIVALATTGKGKLLPFLKEIGLSLTDVKTASRDPLFALLKMSERFSTLSKTEAAGLGAKLGLDRGTINLLSMGREGLEELIKKQREFGVVTVDQAEKAAKFNDTLDEWRLQFDTVKREFVITLLPPITDFFKLLTKVVGWMNDNKTFMIGFFTAVAGVLIGLYAPAVWTAAAATWALVAPYAAIAIAIGVFALALGLVVDDLYAFGQGHDSVVGEVSKKWPLLGALITATGERITWLLAAIEAFATLFVELFSEGPETAIFNFSESIRYLVGVVSEQMPIVGEVFDALTTAMQFGIELVAKAWDMLIASFKSGASLLSDIIDWFGKANEISITGGTKPLFGPSAQSVADAQAGSRILASTNTPIASQTSTSISNQGPRTVHKTVQTGPITVQTPAADGERVAADLGRSLNSQMRAAIDDSDDAVLA